MFDYQKFEADLVTALEHTWRRWAKEYDDIYILSLDCSRDMRSVGILANTKQYLEEQADGEEEDYWYYKYCESEWNLFDTEGLLKEISSCMNKYVEENDEQFTDPETFKFLEAFDEHFDRMTDACKKALQRFSQLVHKDYPDLLLTFDIREYLDAEERMEFFALVNSEEASEEYAEHIDEFN